MTTVKAATIPSQMTAVVTTIDAATGGVRVAWTAPADNAEPITAYRIEFSYSGGWAEDTAACNGTDSTIAANLYCIVPMATLRASPFSLTYDQQIQVRAQAKNAFGWSATSTPTATLTIRTEPAKMNQPVRASESSTTALNLTWAALTTAAETGNSAITSYHV